MLCLGRKQNESVTIDTGRERIVVNVNRIAGGRVILGVEAPQSARIIRTEIDDEEHGSPVG